MTYTPAELQAAAVAQHRPGALYVPTHGLMPLHESTAKYRFVRKPNQVGGTTALVWEMWVDGLRIHLSGKTTVREVDSPEVAFGDNTAISVQSSDTYFDTTLKDGRTAFLICRDKDTLGQRAVFLTARLIDPDGQPTKLAR